MLEAGEGWLNNDEHYFHHCILLNHSTYENYICLDYDFMFVQYTYTLEHFMLDLWNEWTLKHTMIEI